VLGYVLMKVKTRAQMYGKAVFYFGLMFSCLYVVSLITETLGNAPFVLSLVAHTTNVYVGVALGFIVSNILQSSSMTSTIVVLFAAQGLLSLEQALGLLYGANIGTTTTALIASLATDKDGKRVAVGHFLFNVVGVLLFIPLTAPFVELLAYMSGDVAVQVAYAHLLMNVLGAVVFWAGFRYFEHAVRWLVR
jgi:phosphate:Na+ symporter